MSHSMKAQATEQPIIMVKAVARMVPHCATVLLSAILPSYGRDTNGRVTRRHQGAKVEACAAALLKTVSCTVTKVRLLQMCSILRCRATVSLALILCLPMSITAIIASCRIRPALSMALPLRDAKQRLSNQRPCMSMPRTATTRLTGCQR